MEGKILDLIKEYDSIIIARHKSPDFDAYGSQFGLYYALKDNYPDKKIYAVGDTNSLNYFSELDDVSEDVYKESLVLILDTVSSQMLEESVYKHHKKLVLIDHHRNNPDIDYDLAIQEPESSSCSEMIASMLFSWGFHINKESARALYIGIIGDTGRFLYNSTTPQALEMAAKLLETGIDIQEIHDMLYLEPRESKIIKHNFFKRVKYTKNNVAYAINTKDFLDEFNLTSSYVSRGMVNQMAGMIEIPIWVNFTFDTKTEKILCEFRSRDVPVVDVAKKYGGGGHLYASGCYLDKWEHVDLVLNDLDQILEEKK